MRVLVWILRALALLLLIRLIVNAFMGARRRTAAGAGPRPGVSRERALGELVRDPNCGTYVPKASAVVAGSGSNARYFCSVKCRDEHERREQR